MTSYVQLEAAKISQKDRYKLIIGCVVPRPIAWVSSLSKEGATNLAPFSFFNGVSSEPPCVLFCTTARGSDGQKKDTLLNIEETGEFVVNIVTEETVIPMNQTSAEYERGVNEFAEAGLTPVPSLIVKPPRVGESPINLECKLYKLVPVGEGGLGSSTVIIGEIVYFHIREDIYDNGRILTEKLKPVARLAGASYCPVREIFDVPRPVIQSPVG